MWTVGQIRVRRPGRAFDAKSAELHEEAFDAVGDNDNDSH
jgi:hypothetical protein